MKLSSKMMLALLGVGIVAGGVATVQAGAGGYGGHGGFGKRFAMLKLQQSDLDGDGVITREELRKARQQRFGWLDADGDGRITRQEMRRMPLHGKRGVPGRMGMMRGGMMGGGVMNPATMQRMRQMHMQQGNCPGMGKGMGQGMGQRMKQGQPGQPRQMQRRMQMQQGAQ